jgi:hypothetical protein
VIYEDPSQDHWSPHEFQNQSRELGRDWPSQAPSMIGNARMTNLRNIAEIVLKDNVPGDFIATGVWRGGACIMMRAVLKTHGIVDRCVWGADSFCGLPKPNPETASNAQDKHHDDKELAIPPDRCSRTLRSMVCWIFRYVFLKVGSPRPGLRHLLKGSLSCGWMGICMSPPWTRLNSLYDKV